MGNTAVRLLCTFQHYVSIGQLSLLRVVIMPDHVHIVLRAKPEVSFARVIANLKAWVSKSLGIVWQRGFFDHRLRNDESFYEKSLYVAMNPVRKGLCSAPEQWPYAMTWE